MPKMDDTRWLSPAPAPAPAPPARRSRLGRLAAPLIALAALLGKFKALLLLLPKLKLLTTLGSMLASVAAYALIWGWSFGVGFVALILVHELGHFIEAKRQGLDVSIPRFIPFLGAYVAIKNSPLNPMRNALIALAGPVAGGLAAAFCWGLGSLEQSSLLHALAYAGFFLNLVNLIPIGILDGGAIWSAYRLAKSEPMVPLAEGGTATMLPGAGRDRAALILTMYLGLAFLLALGMWGTHVPQSRL
jgi:membrane-associated protease RseP (regulator of RpoE activity)